MKTRRFLASLAAGVLLAAGGMATAIIGNPPGVRPAAAQETAPEECSTEDLNNDPRLGPEQFQRVGRIAAMLVDYDRLADLSPQKFTRHLLGSPGGQGPQGRVDISP